MRLIDADEAFEMADEFPAFEEGLADKTDLKDLLNICDTIEAKPVVHAHWQKYDDRENWYCSYCGAPTETNETVKWSNWCPICGALMDEFAGDINVGSKTEGIFE